MSYDQPLRLCPACGGGKTSIEWYSNPISGVKHEGTLAPKGCKTKGDFVVIARQFYTFVYWTYKGEWFRARMHLKCKCGFEWDGVSSREWISRNRWEKMQRRR